MSSLTRYAVTTRYPGDEEPVSHEEAKEAATLAAQVFFCALRRFRNQVKSADANVLPVLR